MHKETAIRCIDLTTLNENDTEEVVRNLCAKAVTPYGPVAAVCLYPKFVATAKKALASHAGVKVATVVNFPHGNDDIVAAANETKEAVELGADEVDFVFPYRRHPVEEEAFCREFVKAIRAAAGTKTLKAILETGEMTDSTKIAAASTICLEEGVDFLKTSTGKVKVGATPEAAEVMCQTIKKVNPNAGFKASGGVRTFDDCLTYFKIAAKHLGEAFLVADHFRFGASGLLDSLVHSAVPKDGIVDNTTTPATATTAAY